MAVSYSVEIFPPKDEEGEKRLWEAAELLRKISLKFISVTYGAGGSTRNRTIKITKEIKSKTGINTVAHLTCVGSTKVELKKILEQYKNAGISSLLALRGDPPGGPSAEWITTPGGFSHSDQLVELAREFGGFEIGVAAFPDGHPSSKGNFQQDLEVLIRKEQLGATFATTQFFFQVENYYRLIESLQKSGSQLKVIPGILPITNVKQLNRMVELSGTKIPPSIREKIDSIDNSDDVKKYGIEISTKMALDLLNFGAPGIHFYTMNSADSTMAIAKNIGALNEH